MRESHLESGILRRILRAQTLNHVILEDKISLGERQVTPLFVVKTEAK